MWILMQKDSVTQVESPLGVYERSKWAHDDIKALKKEYDFPNLTYRVVMVTGYVEDTE